MILFGVAGNCCEGVHHARLQRLETEGRLPTGRRSFESSAGRQSNSMKAFFALLLP